MRKWYREFKSGHTVRLKSEIIWCCVPDECGIWYCSEYHYKKTEISKNIYSHWILYMLTVKCAAHVVSCKKNLSHFRKERNTFLNHMVTCDWCHYHKLTSKPSSLTWKHKNLLQATKTRSKTSAGKEMLTLFFDVSRPILVVNFKNYQKGRLRAKIVLLHNNTWPHMAGLIPWMFMTLKCKVLTHPVCSPDLSQCDYKGVWDIEEIFGGWTLFHWWRGQKVVKEWMF